MKISSKQEEALNSDEHTTSQELALEETALPEGHETHEFDEMILFGDISNLEEF